VTAPVSFTLPQFSRSPRAFLDLCRQVPALGIKGVFGFDHLVPLGDPHRPVFEGVSVLAAAAVAAPPPSRIGSLVMRTSVRPPDVTAAVVATLGAICGSRAVIGLGVGDRYSADEARRYGMQRGDLDERLRGLEETIALIRQRAPQVAIWIGGTHQALRDTAAGQADGWNAWQVSIDKLHAMVGEVRSSATRPLTTSWGGGVILSPNSASLKENLEKRGGAKAVAAQGLLAGTPDHITAELTARAELVDELVVSVLPNESRAWAMFAKEVLPNLAR
jgi:alkanesulfonate monooxygenase SsuD/methylene tetrahydromethanopterin reductase-like flavin-dependent oxidoreductase (luciferase family)